MAVLSIGMIGVAAAVYFGVDQTRATLDDSVAAAVARQAAAQLGQLMTTANAPAAPGMSEIQAIAYSADPAVFPAGTPKLIDLVKPVQVCATDRRYGWSALYRRVPPPSSAADAPTADVVIAVLRAGARSEFGPDDLVTPTDPQYASGLTASKVRVTLHVDATTGERALEIQNALDRPGGTGALAGGAYLVLTAPLTGMSGGGGGLVTPSLDGRVVQIGGPTTVAGQTLWTMTPGQDLPDVADNTSADACVFGRGYADPLHPENGYAGPNQAIAVYSTTVLLH